MSAIVAINAREFAILASDTRETAFRHDRRTSYRDRLRKVRETSFGLMTAVGLSPLINRVAARCESVELEELGTLIGILREEREALRSCRRHARRGDPLLEATRFCFTFEGVHQGRRQVLVALHDPQAFENKLQVFGGPGAHLIVPFGATQRDQDELKQELVARVLRAPAFASLEESLSFHRGLAFEFIRKASAFKASSADGHVGLHHLWAGCSVEYFDNVRRSAAPAIAATSAA